MKSRLTKKQVDKFATMQKIILSILSVIVFSTPLMAQEPAIFESVIPGNRLRVTAAEYFQKTKIRKPLSNRARVVGTVMTANADTLFLKIDNQPEPVILSVPVASLKKLEVSRGKNSKTGSVAGIGFLVGAIAGAALGYHADERGNDLAPEHAALIGAGYGGLIGILIGAATGSRMRGDRWEEVTLK